jgi:hypothetical protein
VRPASTQLFNILVEGLPMTQGCLHPHLCCRTFRSAVKQLIEEGGAMKHLKVWWQGHGPALY